MKLDLGDPLDTALVDSVREDYEGLLVNILRVRFMASTRCTGLVPRLQILFLGREEPLRTFGGWGWTTPRPRRAYGPALSTALLPEFASVGAAGPSGVIWASD